MTIILSGTTYLSLFALYSTFPLLDSEGNTSFIGSNCGWLTVYFDKVRINNFSKIMQRERIRYVNKHETIETRQNSQTFGTFETLVFRRFKRTKQTIRKPKFSCLRPHAVELKYVTLNLLLSSFNCRRLQSESQWI